MAKSVYSLVLADEVVAAIDGMAAGQGLSRSALVEHVLAQYASMQTPQTRTRQILTHLQGEVWQGGMRTAATSASALTLRTALPYKYNPALSYIVELKGDANFLGRLRVTLRSTSEAVLAYFGLFFELWQALEQKHLPTPPGAEFYQKEEKRHSRRLRHPARQKSEEMARAIAGYIAVLDGCIKVFFDHLEDAHTAAHATEQQYLRLLARFPEAAEL